MDLCKVWKADRKISTPGYNFIYPPFELQKSNLKKLSLMRYQNNVDEILKQVRELQINTKAHISTRGDHTPLRFITMCEQNLLPLYYMPQIIF